MSQNFVVIERVGNTERMVLGMPMSVFLMSILGFFFIGGMAQFDFLPFKKIILVVPTILWIVFIFKFLRNRPVGYFVHWLSYKLRPRLWRTLSEQYQCPAEESMYGIPATILVKREMPKFYTYNNDEELLGGKKLNVVDIEIQKL